MRFPEGLERVTATAPFGPVNGCRVPNSEVARSVIGGELRRVGCPAIAHLAHCVILAIGQEIREKQSSIRPAQDVIYGMVANELVCLFLDRKSGADENNCPAILIVVPAEVVASVCSDVAAGMVNVPKPKSCGKAN